MTNEALVICRRLRQGITQPAGPRDVPMSCCWHAANQACIASLWAAIVQGALHWVVVFDRKSG